MFKILFIYIYLFSLVLCTYRPLPLRNLTFAGDVCYYRDILSNSQIEYVKSCDSGKFCTPLEDSSTPSPNYEIKTCQEYNNFFKTVGDECSRDFECDSTLICSSSSKKCEFNGLIPYDFICKPGYVFSRSSFSCVAETESNKDKCQTNDVDASGNLINTENYEPGNRKFCGEIEVIRRTATSDHYIVKTKKASLIGSVPDGNFVLNKMACESGYALYFYGNKDITNPLGSSATDDEMFLLCVTVLGFDTVHNIIKYKIGNEGDIYYYNIQKIPSTRVSPSTETIDFNEYTMTELKMFQNYITRFNQIKSECLNNYDINDPTCRDNELRKWFYFYEHPKEYLLYQNEPDVIDYLIQQEYKEYLPIRNETDNSSGFINVSIMMILFLLILY